MQTVFGIRQAYAKALGRECGRMPKTDLIIIMNINISICRKGPNIKHTAMKIKPEVNPFRKKEMAHQQRAMKKAVQLKRQELEDEMRTKDSHARESYRTATNTGS